MAITSGGISVVFAQENSPTLHIYQLKRNLLAHSALFNPNSDPRENLKLMSALIEGLKDHKNYTHTLALELQDQVQRGDALDGIQLDLISKTLEAFVQYSIAIGHYTNTYAPGLSRSPYNLFDNPQGDLDLKEFMWLSGHMALFDYVYQAHTDFYSVGILRRVLKDIVTTDSRITKRVKELAEVLQKTMSLTNRMTLENSVRRLQEYRNQILSRHSQNDTLKKEIALTLTLPSTREMLSGRPILFKDHHLIDNLIVGINDVTNILSGYFGNAAGAIRWRSGRLYNDPVIHKKIEESMRPLDIIAERTPFALTDFFIPGNFGHIAIWLGSEDQLKEYGIWDHPLIAPHHEAIRNGVRILEAVRPKTRLAKLEEFLNIDELAVIRQENLFDNRDLVSDIISRAMPQLGKDYDFNFDVTTVSKIVCSELIYHAYAQIKWPTTYMLGRATISPDQVAELALWENSPVHMSSYVLGKKEGKVEDLSIFDFAKNLGYVVNKELSTQARPMFDKPYQKCRKVERFNRLRVGSRRGERIQINVCETAYKHYVYQD